MSLSVKLRKLTKMAPAEIGCRVGERLRTWNDRRAYRRGAANSDKSQDATICRLAGPLFDRALEMVPGHAPNDLRALKTEHRATYDLVLEHNRRRVETLTQGRSLILGKQVDLSGPIDWNRDPVNGYHWPRRFYADVAVYDANSPADVKYVWEVNRHQFLVDLAQGWLLQRDEHLASRVRELTLSWIDQNRLYEGVNWTSGLEVAMRSVSWLWTLAALATWDGWRADDRMRVAGSLVDHATFLSRHLSFYTSPYNHLIGEAAALYLLGCWLSEHPTANAWRTKGRRVLEEHGPAQFYDDGFCVEQATSYHFYSLGFLCLAVNEARRREEPISEVEEACDRAFRAAMRLQQPNGCWPEVGDLDSARSVPVIPADHWDFRSLCALGVTMFDLPPLKNENSSPGGEVVWTLGTAGVEKWRARDTSAVSDATALPCSGYVSARSDDGPDSDWFLFDAGPLAHGVHADSTASTAHGHADALNLLLHLNGQPVLVDSGLPFYAGDQKWIEYFRSPAAHNTIEVEGAPWARPASRLAWSHVQRAPRLETNLSEDLWVVRSQLQLTEGVSIERNILGLPGSGVWIADLVKSDQPRIARWYWQTTRSQEPRLSQRDNFFCEVSLSGGALVSWTGKPGWNTRITTAADGSPVGWQSPGYGELVAGHRIMLEASPVTERLVVTNVARTSAAATVRVGEHQLTCARQGESDEDARGDACEIPQEAEIAWQVETPSGMLLVAVGRGADGGAENSSQSKWRRQNGVGDLRVATREVALTETTT